MTNVSTLPAPQHGNHRAAVVASVRAHFAIRNVKDSTVARSIGLSQSYLSRRTNGETAFDVDDLGAIANLFGITISELIELPTTIPTDRVLNTVPSDYIAPVTDLGGWAKARPSGASRVTAPTTGALLA